MQKVDKEKAEKVLRTANENPVYQDDTIGVSIDSILRGPHKTYRYVLVTALLAKSTNKDVDILSLQAKDNSVGAYDARSLCHKVIVPYIEERVSKFAWTPSAKVSVVVSSLGDYAALYGLEYCLRKKIKDEVFC
jgi:hypothetical protein